VYANDFFLGFYGVRKVALWFGRENP